MKSEALRLRHRHRLDEFCRYCFPEVAYLPFNAFHQRILSRPKVDSARRTRNHRRAFAAPRGIAKSTHTKLVVAHDVAIGLERVVLVLSATRPDASGWSKTLRAWFSDPSSAIAKLYGPFTVTCGLEEIHITGPRRTETNDSRSFRSDIRGLNVATVRPTRVIVDDGESGKHVSNPDIRRQWQKFLNEDVLKIGRKEGGTLFDWLGTILHPDSILARIIDKRGPNKGWSAEKWKALIKWPDRLDHWEECRAVWADLDDDPDPEAREDAARAFYEAHRVEMDAGSEVLDPAALGLFAIYLIIWNEGLASALKELNNDPSDPSERIFDTDGFRRCEYDRANGRIVSSGGRAISIRECSVGVWLDPIPAKRTGSDYAALAIVARHTETTRRYVLECHLKRCGPSEQRAWMWSAFDQYGPRARYGYEDNGFQTLFGEGFKRDRQDRKAAGRVSTLRPEGLTSTTNKVERMSRLEPDCVHGFLEFATSIDPEVIGQFRDLPGATHDDGPDAIERADFLATRSTGAFFYQGS